MVIFLTWACVLHKPTDFHHSKRALECPSEVSEQYLLHSPDTHNQPQWLECVKTPAALWTSTPLSWRTSIRLERYYTHVSISESFTQLTCNNTITAIFYILNSATPIRRECKRRETHSVRLLGCIIVNRVHPL